MRGQPKPWHVAPDRDPEKGLQLLRLRFQRVSRRWKRRIRLRRFGRLVGFFLLWSALAIGLAWVMLKTLSPWPPTATIKHLLSFPNCAAARAVGLAPARKGQPGYWSGHDADNDGIACEPLPRRLREVAPGVYKTVP